MYHKCTEVWRCSRGQTWLPISASSCDALALDGIVAAAHKMAKSTDSCFILRTSNDKLRGRVKMT